jgi:hypothetical protein
MNMGGVGFVTPRHDTTGTHNCNGLIVMITHNA